jgi:putative membrane protein
VSEPASPADEPSVDTIDLPTQWSRLSPLSPVVRGGSAAVGLVTIAGANAAAQHQRPWDAIIVFVVATAGAVISWIVTRWRVYDGELQVNKGLIRRQQIRIPVTRVQGIDLIRPLPARMLGLSEVRPVLAGHDSGRARLTYLPEERAASVRAQLLALAHGLHDDTPEPAERPILHVPGSRIVAAHLLSTRFAVGLVLLVGAIAGSIVKPSLIAYLVSPAIVLLTATLLVTGRQTSAEWEYQLGEAPDGLRLRSGLLQTRSETIRHGRVQAVRWIEPLWWRPFGWVRLEFDVARRRNSERDDRQSGATSRALLPVGTREQARWLLDRVLPGAVGELAPSLGAPRRSVWRVPLGRRYLRLQQDTSYISCCTGRLRPDTVIVPLEKVQSIRWSQGAWSRRLGLASVKVDTAGQRFTAAGRFRDAAEAQHLMDLLPDLARAARDRTASRR